MVEDPRPTLQHFFIMMEGEEPWGDSDDHTRDPGDLFGVTFQVLLYFCDILEVTVFSFDYSTVHRI